MRYSIARSSIQLLPLGLEGWGVGGLERGGLEGWREGWLERRERRDWWLVRCRDAVSCDTARYRFDVDTCIVATAMVRARRLREHKATVEALDRIKPR